MTVAALPSVDVGIAVVDIAEAVGVISVLGMSSVVALAVVNNAPIVPV